MASRSRETLVSGVYRFLPLALFIVFWQVAGILMPRGAFFLGSPKQVLVYLIDGITEMWLLSDALVTGLEALAGFAFGNLLGLAAGILLWWFPRVSAILKPYITLLGAAPLFALAPLLVLWFGTGFTGKVATATLSTVFVALAHAFQGAHSIPANHSRLVRAFGGGRSQLFRIVAVPAMLQWVLAAFRLNVGFALLGAFLGEFLSAERGLGKRILVAMGLFDMSMMIVGIVGLVGLAGVLHWLVHWTERRVQSFITI